MFLNVYYCKVNVLLYLQERNYHIFYYMFAGLSSEDANKFYLQVGL